MKRDIRNTIRYVDDIISVMERPTYSDFFEYNIEILNFFKDVFKRKIIRPLKEIERNPKINEYLTNLSEAFFNADINRISDIAHKLDGDKELISGDITVLEPNLKTKIGQKIKYLVSASRRSTFIWAFVTLIFSIIIIQLIVKFHLVGVEQNYQLGAIILAWAFLYKITRE